MQTAPVRPRKRALLAKFFADRGTHLAAMVAYFALLSFVPLIFLSLALLGLALAGACDEGVEAGLDGGVEVAAELDGAGGHLGGVVEEDNGVEADELVLAIEGELLGGGVHGDDGA